MKVLILYRPNSEHDTAVQGFLREYKARTNRDIELISLDTPEGADRAKVYGIVEYPAILAMGDDGQLQKAWQGDTLPLIDEVSYYNSL